MRYTPPKYLKISLKVAACAATLLWTGISWIEAEKEVRILCGTFAPEQTMEEVTQVLDTGHYLRYRLHSGDEAPADGALASEGRGDLPPAKETQRVIASSYYNGLGTACTVTLRGGRVAASAYRDRAHWYALSGG